MSHSILFAHLGSKLPPWLKEALYQARIFNSCPIILIADSEALAKEKFDSALNITAVSVDEIGISCKHKLFRKISPLDQSFRDGFWTSTTERFFIIESAMKHLSLANVIHLENDVLLYCNLDELIDKLSSLYPALAATFDNDIRCIPGIIYIHNLQALSQLTKFMIQKLQNAAQSTLNLSAMNQTNDMVLLNDFRLQNPNLIAQLPVIPADYRMPLQSLAGHISADYSFYWRNFDSLKLIFDAAALGQYLGGVDSRNIEPPTSGFINESCLFDPRELKVRMSIDEQNRKIPVVETESGIHKVANLHMHSKNLLPFLSIEPPFV